MGRLNVIVEVHSGQYQKFGDWTPGKFMKRLSERLIQTPYQQREL